MKITTDLTEEDYLVLIEEARGNILNHTSHKPIKMIIGNYEIIADMQCLGVKISDGGRTIEDVIDYMNDEKRSWLPQICKEIDEEISEINIKIEELKNKISSLEKDKEKLYDEDYLKSKIETEYTFDSQFYKSIKNSIK